MALESARIESARISRAVIHAQTTKLGFLIADMLLYAFRTVEEMLSAEAGFFNRLTELVDVCVEFASDENLEQGVRERIPDMVKQRAKSILRSVQKSALRATLVALGSLDDLSLEYSWQTLRLQCQQNMLNPENVLKKLEKLKGNKDAIKAAMPLILGKDTRKTTELLSTEFGPQMPQLLCVGKEEVSQRWSILVVLFELILEKDHVRPNTFRRAADTVAAILKEVDLENYPPKTRTKNKRRQRSATPRRLSFGS